MTAGAVLDERNAEGVQVSILKAEASWNPPAWTLHYEVSNTMQSAVWLVIDESVKVIQDGSRIELSYARGRLQPGAHVFGYFDPQVIPIEPGGRVERRVEISWPATLNDLWNAEREAAPEPGMYEVSVRVGYGTTAEPGPFQEGNDVEGPVLRWQMEALSAPVTLEIPAFDSSHLGDEREAGQ